MSFSSVLKFLVLLGDHRLRQEQTPERNVMVNGQADNFSDGDNTIVNNSHSAPPPDKLSCIYVKF